MRQKRYNNIVITNDEHIRCAMCDEELELTKVTMTYLKSTFPTRILRCPKCGEYYLSEDLVATKVNEVEEYLEEK